MPKPLIPVRGILIYQGYLDRAAQTDILAYFRTVSRIAPAFCPKVCLAIIGGYCGVGASRD